MDWIPQIFRRPKIYDELADEMRLHIEERAEQLMRDGMDAKEAERQARVAFGNPTLLEERSREVWQWPTLESIWADLRFSVRQLRRSRGITIAAVLTLALAIGANAIVFGLMDGLILRPLNVPQSENLYGTNYGNNSTWQSYPNYVELRDRNHSFEDLAAFNMVLGVGLDTGTDPGNANGFATTGNYFDVLQIKPTLGRFFNASDEHGPNSAPYIVLTNAYWHARFRSDPGVIGRQVRLDQHPYTIIGVAPPGFQGTISFLAPDFFMPIVNQEQLGTDSLTNRFTEHALFESLGHLKPGVTPSQAVADVNAVSAYLEKTYPKQIAHKSTALNREGLTSFAPAALGFMSALMLLAALILLAACANLGSLFAAHTADRSREIALRLALGSNRTRILRQLFTEAVLISLAGGAFGLLASMVLLRRLSVWQPMPDVPIHLPVSPDAKLYAVALGLALISAFLFGIVPVRQVLRANPYEIVKAGTSARLGKRVTVRDGRFEVKLPCGAMVVGLTIGAPGYALKLARVAVPSESDPSPDANKIILIASGGTLELDLKPPGRTLESSMTPYLVHNGAVEFAGRLATWGTDRASGDGSGEVDAIEPGVYALCLVADPSELTALWQGKLPPDECRADSVVQGRTLTLSPQ